MDCLSNDELLKLDNQLCFAVYACSREIIKYYRPYLDKLGLTYTQYITMMVLWEAGRISAKDLGMRLHLDSGTLTPLLKKLEHTGLIERHRNSVDERSLIITLTDKGQNLKNRAGEIPEKMFCGLKLTMEELVSLREQLKTVTNNLTEEK